MNDQIEMNPNATGLREIQLEVGKWSRHNFGNQTSTVTKQVHGSLHPLLGIGEEIGELFDSVTGTEDQQQAMEHDALGDIAVYLCDFACRESIIIDTLLRKRKAPPNGYPLDALTGLVSSMGRLYHTMLKHHQGIRGFDVNVTFKNHRDAQVVRLWRYLDKMCRVRHNQSAVDVLSTVWAKVVEKRDWRTNPVLGN